MIYLNKTYILSKVLKTTFIHDVENLSRVKTDAMNNDSNPKEYIPCMVFKCQNIH